ncbi:hypothetical protein U1E44_11640 [Arenibacter sp. GZD96]|uniref:hypothetical protein n=1 Tax=Aurantibrevibacter litoralis TaxID=3106030 RepID=UPI002AFFA4B1|nr:hypothetical protein [Arenibacter sp. GZD-96]MEA1786748.1 hypothetical protein [Arenibacter sp. GZD-96]
MQWARSVYSVIMLVMATTMVAKAQVPVRAMHSKVKDSGQYEAFGVHKKIPNQIKTQVLTALSYYPELQDTRIIFRLRKKNTPLSSRPQVISAFKGMGNRTYIITISTKTNKKLRPILLANLPYNAQIGVLGHELAHVVTYETMRSSQLVQLPLKMLNKKFTDSFEFRTDLVCIEHGLGHQLYDWSSYVREALQITEWRGASLSTSLDQNESERQRYMNPDTILSYMNSIPIYNSSQ